MFTITSNITSITTATEVMMIVITETETVFTEELTMADTTTDTGISNQFKYCCKEAGSKVGLFFLLHVG